MDTWTRQMGFPLVTVKRENATTGIFSATQTRFLLTEKVPNITITRSSSSPFKYKWYIPLSYYTDRTNYKSVDILWMNMTNSKSIVKSVYFDVPIFFTFLVEYSLT